MSPLVDWKILNIGLQHVNTLTNNVESDFIHMDRNGLIEGFRKIYSYIKDYNPDVIHCFDYNSWIVLNAVRKFIYKPLVFTKCGGSNMVRFIPSADHYIYFSKENLRFHEQHAKSKSRVSLLPNRVDDVIQDNTRIQKLIEDYALQDKYVLLRISRFSQLHKDSIIQAIETLKLLCGNEQSSRQYVLLLVGIIQSDEVIREIEQTIKGLPIILINDFYYTHNASQLIDVADVVVASGRGVMEAASRTKKILCPLQNSLFPAPFNPENFDKLFERNFSGRVNNITTTQEDILSFLNTEEPDNFSLAMYEKYFAIRNVISEYKGIYENVRHKKPKFSFREWYVFFLTTCYFILKMPRRN